MNRRIMTVPNLLGVLRLVLSPGLVLLALAQAGTGFLALFLFLEATDWLDGKLAALLDQRTTFGSRLDTVADAMLYGALLVGLILLEGSTFLDLWPWLSPALVTFAASWGLSLWKFGVLPSYHAWSAKSAWALSLLAAVALLALDRTWPVQVAALAVATANLEAIALTIRLDESRSDVRSIFLAKPKESSTDSGGDSGRSKP